MKTSVRDSAPSGWLYAMIFVLVAIDFLQSGMTAFGAAPIMGQISVSPEDFSLIAAVYASIAILVISMQRWFVERLGGLRYVQAATAITAAGAVLCALSGSFNSFLIGRIVMAIGGGGLMTSARMIIHHRLAGPRRFTGIKFLAGAVALSIAAAPWVASLAVAHETWSAMYWLVAAIAAAAFVIASISLNDQIIGDVGLHSTANPALQLLLIIASFAVLYALQRFYYDFYGEVVFTAAVFVLAVIALATYLWLQHRSAEPLLRVKPMFKPRYLSGLALFLFAYTLLGANNTMIPLTLQRSLGYSWETVGHFEALGFSAAFITWMVLSRLLPRYPAPKKYFVVGFLCLSAFGLLLSRLTPTANLWSDILPALALNSVFLLILLPVTAMQTFREMDQDESLFSNAQQLKNMMAQAGIAIGISLATIGQHWRSTVHYGALNRLIDADSPVYQATIRQIQQSLAAGMEPAQSGPVATAQVAQMLSQQASLLGNIDYFSFIAVVGLAGAFAMLVQKVFR